jgi:hypothetical protein
MRFLKIAGSLILVGLIGAALAWFARGVWDEQFLMEGHFHVTNHSDENVDVELQFPSGAKFDCELQGSGSADFRIKNTGEGSVKVLVNGKVVDSVGYVTSMNSIVILSVSESRVVFSQIFPSIKTEQVGAPNPLPAE